MKFRKKKTGISDSDVSIKTISNIWELFRSSSIWTTNYLEISVKDRKAIVIW